MPWRETHLPAKRGSDSGAGVSERSRSEAPSIENDSRRPNGRRWWVGSSPKEQTARPGHLVDVGDDPLPDRVDGGSRSRFARSCQRSAPALMNRA